MGPQFADMLYIDEKISRFEEKSLNSILRRRTAIIYSYLGSSLASVKLVDCTGHPKPDQLGNVPYIKLKLA